MPRIGHERLSRFCDRYGVSVRATFEAVTLVILDDEQDPARAPLVAGMWDVARHLAASDVFAPGMRSEYPKLVVRIDRHLHALFVDACRRHRLSQNASYAFVVMPWPTATPAEIVAYKRTITPRLVETARALDAERRAVQVAGLIPFPVTAR